MLVCPVYVLAPVSTQVPEPSLVNVPVVVSRLPAKLLLPTPPKVSPKVAPVTAPALDSVMPPAMALMRLAEPSVSCPGRIQPVDATHSLNISAGVWKPSVLRGLSFNCRAIALS